MAGDELIALEDEKSAKQVSEHRIQKQRSKELAQTNRLSLEKLYEQIQQGAIRDLNIIIKADVHGSIEALGEALTKLSNEEVKVNVVHSATGTITESDIFDTVTNAFELGWRTIKLYFMNGLPTETQEDIQGICDLSRRLAGIRVRQRRMNQLTVDNLLYS